MPVPYSGSSPTPAGSSLRPAEVEAVVARAVSDGALERRLAEELAAGLLDERVREPLLQAADASKRATKGARVSVSKNLFLPLTNLCRDRCAYCTFAVQPDDPTAKTYTLEEVEAAVKDGVRAGCVEALFCLGDKPEVAYESHREWLAARGWKTTTEHLVEACRVGFETGMLPHTNAGLLTIEEMAALKPWNASMGLMLENTSERLREKGQAHFYCPDKDPKLRIRMHEEAGQLKIPFTSGLLLGIGENDAERVDTLLEIRRIADEYGHIQEVIVQPFHAKDDTPMRGVPSISHEEIAGWVALARLILGPDMNVQAPPNLAPDVLEMLLRSGLNDWGGVSPVTVDFINPEAPWPELKLLRERTEAAGQALVERLPVYPEHLALPEYFDPRMREECLRRVDETGYLPNRQEAA